jgi:DNA-binding transcriptional LysR family regulator
MACD